MVLDHPGPMGVLGNPRCKRFACLIVDGVIKTMHVSEGENGEDPAGDDDPSGEITKRTSVETLLSDLDK